MKMSDTADAKRGGRPGKTSKRQRRLLSRMSKVNPFMTAREAWNESKVMPDISLSTVRRYLRESNLYSRVAADAEYVANSKTI